MSSFLDSSLTVVGALVVASLLWVAREVRRRRLLEREKNAKVERIIRALEGSPADVLANTPQQLGLVTEIAQMREKQAEMSSQQGDMAAQQDVMRRRQEEIATVAQTAAADVAAVRSELTRNGGSSTKDAVHQAARSAEAAAAETTEVKNLLKRHMENGIDIMAVGRHNDGQMIAAVESLGGEVTDLREYPPVDTGE